MAIVSTRQPTPSEPVESIEAKFTRLASIWLAETACVSSSSELVGHPAFEEIVNMGAAVIPLLLREMANRSSGHWHRALRRITGLDPVPLAERGNIDKSAAAWLKWAKEQKYEW